MAFRSSFIGGCDYSPLILIAPRRHRRLGRRLRRTPSRRPEQTISHRRDFAESAVSFLYII